MNIFVGAPGREFLGSSEIFIMLFVTFGPINFINRFYRMAAGVGMKAQAGLRGEKRRDRDRRHRAVGVGRQLHAGEVASLRHGGRLHGRDRAVRRGHAGDSGPVRRCAQAPPAADGAAQSPSAAASQLVFPYIATPYGIAILIVLLMLAPDSAKDIYITLLIVMLINLIMMLLVKPFMRVLGLPLGLLGTVVAVLQLALSIQFALFAIRTALVKGV